MKTISCFLSAVLCLTVDVINLKLAEVNLVIDETKDSTQIIFSYNGMVCYDKINEMGLLVAS